MEAGKIIEYVAKNILHLATIMFILVISLQLNKEENNIEIAENNKNIQEIIKTEEIAENNNQRIPEKSKITSRSSAVRKREKLEDIKVEEPEIQYTKIEDVKISKNMDLTIRTGMSKEDFKALISKVKHDKSKFFYDNSDLIYDLCQEYQINEIFFCGLISAESGWNIASNHRRTHNYISLMTKNGLIKYNSVEEGLTVAAQKLHDNYLTEGGRFYHGKTLSGVKTKFCPASSTWVDLVYGRMQQIMRSR